MNKKLSVVIGLILLLAISAGSYFWATGMISSNFSYRSQLKEYAPTPGQKLGEPATQRVVIVLIDALRYDTSMDKTVMPFLNELRNSGAAALMHSQPPSFSEPAYSTILTGAWPEFSDGPAFNLDYADIPTFTQDNLFSSAHRAGFKTAISGYYWFEKLVPQTDVDFSFYTPGEDAAADREVVDAALPWLKNNDAQLVLIHIDQVDYAGHHEGGPQSPNWDASATRADDLLKEIAATLNLEKDTLVVLSDHGQIDAGGHGGQDPVALLEPVVISGAGAKVSAQTEMNQVDFAPTMAALLGINLPASAQGVVRIELVNLSNSVVLALPTAVQEQQRGLLSAYSKALGSATSIESLASGSDVVEYQKALLSLRDNKVLTGRILRAIPAAILLAFGVTLLVRKRHTGSIGWVLGGLLFVILFNFRYAVLDRKVYSLSSIISQMDLILYVAITAAIVFVITYLVVMVIQKGFKEKSLDAALHTVRIGFSTVFIVSLPVVLSFVINGAVVTWFLPDYLTSFIALLCLIQILVISVLTPLLSGVSALVTSRNKN
jgi:hypothetical protein